MFVAYTPLHADISPNPIRGKGIVPGDSLKIRMVSEKVNVTLYRDHFHFTAQFREEGQKIIWEFKELEPSTVDDILIKYSKKEQKQN